MKKENEDVKFEDAMKQLEEIANELEKGDLSLDLSVNKFEQGMELSKKCSRILEDSEKKINILIQENGSLTEKPY